MQIKNKIQSSNSKFQKFYATYWNLEFRFLKLNLKVDSFEERSLITFTNRNAFIANQNFILLNGFHVFYIDDIRAVTFYKIGGKFFYNICQFTSYKMVLIFNGMYIEIMIISFYINELIKVYFGFIFYFGFCFRLYFKKLRKN